MSRDIPLAFNPPLSTHEFRLLRSKRWPAGLLLVLGALLLPNAAWAQGTITYHFSGQVGSFNVGSTIFPGVGTGSPVEGDFVIDYAALDEYSWPEGGSYVSPQVSFAGTIGGSGFSSLVASYNRVSVTDGPAGIDGDFVILQVRPGGGLDQLDLTFYDSTGQTISGDALPGSAAAFRAFPAMVLYARGINGFGQYILNVSIDQVPEPSEVILGGLGLAIFGIVHRRRRSVANQC